MLVNKSLGVQSLETISAVTVMLNPHFNTNDRLRTELREKLKKQRALRDKGSTGEPTVKDSEHKQDDHIADFRKQGEYGAKKNIKP